MRHLVICLCLSALACTADSDKNKGLTRLMVIHSAASLREAPGVRSREILKLKKGEGLVEQGETSTFLTALQLDGQSRQAPWIRVKTQNGQYGWVYARVVRPVSEDADAWYLQKNMLAYWGRPLTERRNRLDELRARVQDAAGFARYYRESTALRDTLMQALAQRAEPNEADFKPDYSWLPQVLQGFVFQWINGGTQAFLFADYHYWQTQAAATAGDTRDDQFVRLCMRAFPLDSIESFFPGWIIQTDDFGGSSQLGLGLHLNMLQQIAICRQQEGRLFEPELIRFKEAVLNDILDKNTTYWQPKEKILNEMRQIIALPAAVLDERDKLALRERLPMFEAAPENGVVINLRNGR